MQFHDVAFQSMAEYLESNGRRRDSVLALLVGLSCRRRRRLSRGRFLGTHRRGGSVPGGADLVEFLFEEPEADQETCKNQPKTSRKQVRSAGVLMIHNTSSALRRKAGVPCAVPGLAQAQSLPPIGAGPKTVQ